MEFDDDATRRLNVLSGGDRLTKSEHFSRKWSARGRNEGLGSLGCSEDSLLPLQLDQSISPMAGRILSLPANRRRASRPVVSQA